MKNRRCSIVRALFLVIIILSGCSEHNKLLRDGWEVNEQEDGYEKIEEYPINSDKSKEVLQELEGFWIDSVAQKFYVVFEEEGIFLEGYDVYQFYPYEEISFSVTQIIRAPDGIKGELAPPSVPMYKLYMDNLGTFGLVEKLDYLEFLITLEDDEASELVSLSFVTEEGASGGYLVIFERTSGYDIPIDYKYARGINYSYYIENQIMEEGLVTTGKDEQQIAEEKERINEKKEKEKKKADQEEQEKSEREEKEKIESEKLKEEKRKEDEQRAEEEKIEQEKREEKERIVQEKRNEEERKKIELEEQKESEVQGSKDIIKRNIDSILGSKYSLHFSAGSKDYKIYPEYDALGGFGTFIVNEKYMNESPSSEWIKLAAAVEKSTQEIYNNYGNGNVILYDDINQVLLQYENGKLIFNAMD